MSVTQTVEDRLQPLPVSLTNSKIMKTHSALIRSTSFDKIRQFPTYFCRQSSSEITQWLSSSQSKISAALADISKQLRLALLTISVYGAVALLVIQLILSISVLAQIHLLPGHIFLLICVPVIASMAVLSAPKPLKQIARGRSRALTQIKKNN